MDLELRLLQVINRLRLAEQMANRPAGSVQLLAVSKTHSATSIRKLAAFGQYRFGENYLQEAQTKIALLNDLALEWHFIGHLQANKTRQIAALFQWVHSVDRVKLAERLSAQRPNTLPPLNICLEVNVSGELTKSGVAPGKLLELANAVAILPNLTLRGLMTIPAPNDVNAFRKLAQLFDELQTKGLNLDTLSMGMSDDLELAVTHGATMVRIGTAIFGSRATQL